MCKKREEKDDHHTQTYIVIEKKKYRNIHKTVVLRKNFYVKDEHKWKRMGIEVYCEDEDGDNKNTIRR